MDNGNEQCIEIIHTSSDSEIAKLVKVILHQYGSRRIYTAPSPEMLLRLVQQHYGTDTVKAKKITAYLLRRLTNLNLGEVAAMVEWTPADVALNSRTLDQQLANSDTALKESLKTILVDLQREGLI